jgi:hypothetical protein
MADDHHLGILAVRDFISGAIPVLTTLRKRLSIQEIASLRPT